MSANQGFDRAPSNGNNNRLPDPNTARAADLPGAYCFSLKIDVKQQLVGQVMGGYRIDLEYVGGNGSVNFGRGNSALSAQALERLRVAPMVLSGNDWIFLSKGGQVDFDSRVTLQFGD